VSDDMLSAEIEPQARATTPAAMALQQRGFRILHSGPTISVEGARSLWASTFGLSFQSDQQPGLALTGKTTTYWVPTVDPVPIPEDWQSLIQSIAFVRPPELFGGMR
jgi:hypothetical protein